MTNRARGPRVLVLSVVLSLVFAAFASAALAEAPAFVGKWKLSAVSTKDGPVPKEKLAKGGMIWEFLAGGTLNMTVTAEGKSVTAKATWTVDAKQVISIVEGVQTNKVTYQRKASDLIISATSSTVKMTFTKMR